MINRFLKPGTYLFYFQRLIKAYSLREWISNVYGKIIGKVSIPENNFLNFSYNPQQVKELRENGFVIIPQKLPDNIIDSILASTKDLDLIDIFNRSLGSFKLNNISSKTHVADFNRQDLIALPYILDIANDSEILKIVQEFLGGKPTISNINLWWSFAGRDKAEDAQLFHRDVDDIKFVKLFIYLTDVGDEDGPHTYVKSSSSINKLTKIRRYQDKEIIDVFGKDSIINFLGSKGTMFLEDTYGFHKGTLPKSNNRLVMQVQYSLMPIWIENYEPINININNYNKYINRLIVKA